MPAPKHHKIQEFASEYRFDYKKAKPNRFAKKMNLKVGWTVEKSVAFVNGRANGKSPSANGKKPATKAKAPAKAKTSPSKGKSAPKKSPAKTKSSKRTSFAKAKKKK